MSTETPPQDPTPSPQPKPAKKRVKLSTWDKLPDHPTQKTEQAVDWEQRSGQGRQVLRGTERLALVFKEPFDRLIGTSQLNPLYYSGVIGFFLLMVVTITGIYILMFYQYGYDVSYTSIESMEAFIGSSVARAIHRYASGGLIVFGLLHAVRMFFMDRFRGPRWLAWVAGIGTFVIFWLTGVTGYWLIWDQSAQLVTQAFINLLNLVPPMATGFYFQFLALDVADTNGWMLMLLLVIVHIALALGAGYTYWLHIKRLKKPKFFPPVYWMVVMLVIFIILSAIFPARLLPSANFSVIPENVPLDIFYLFYVPPSLQGPAMAFGIILAVILISIIFSVFPWVFPKTKLEPVTITADRCTGCENCVDDCPYNALVMIPRDDNTQFKTLAQVDPNLCVSCGVCIGSCDTMAISLGDNKPELLWDTVATRLDEATEAHPGRQVKMVFTCERHAAHGAHTYAQARENLRIETAADTIVEVVPVTCVAMVNPRVMTHAIQAGADEVQVIGCPPNDCTNRVGNAWMEERLHRDRTPKLPPSFKDAPITSMWLAPDQFTSAFETAEKPQPPVEQTAPKTWQQIRETFSQRSLIVATVLLLLGLLLQIFFTYLPYQPYADFEAGVQLALRSATAQQVTLTVDDAVLYSAPSSHVLEVVEVSPGEHHVIVTQGDSDVLFDDVVTIGEREVLRLDFDQ